MHNTMETKVEQIMMMAMLNDYAVLNRELSSLTEEQLWTLIETELANRKRKSFLERIHQRFGKLKIARERAELLAGAV